jgi:hypothetical protein
LATAALARPGPDVTLLNIPDTTNHGVVGAVRAYSIGSNTCNIGNQNLLWLSNGSPGLAMNMYRLYDGRLTHAGHELGEDGVLRRCDDGVRRLVQRRGRQPTGRGMPGHVLVGVEQPAEPLAPRWAINGFTGAFQSFSGNSGDAVFKRLQVAQSDLVTNNFPARCISSRACTWAATTRSTATRRTTRRTSA